MNAEEAHWAGLGPSDFDDVFQAPWKCSCCGEEKNAADPSWRWNGEAWEHKCGHPQAGHFAAESRENVMKVENYELDISYFNATTQTYGRKRVDVELPKKVVRRLLNEAAVWMKDYLDLSKHEVSLVLDDGIVGEVTWTNAKGRSIKLTGIYFDHETGEILQAGRGPDLCL